MSDTDVFVCQCSNSLILLNIKCSLFLYVFLLCHKQVKVASVMVLIIRSVVDQNLVFRIRLYIVISRQTAYAFY